MAEHATLAAEVQQPTKKRSLLKLLLLWLNVLLFLAGVGSLAWTKFGPKLQGTATVAQEQPSDTAHEASAQGHEALAKAQGGHGGGRQKGMGAAPQRSLQAVTGVRLLKAMEVGAVTHCSCP